MWPASVRGGATFGLGPPRLHSLRVGFLQDGESRSQGHASCLSPLRATTNETSTSPKAAAETAEPWNWGTTAASVAEDEGVEEESVVEQPLEQGVWFVEA